VTVTADGAYAVSGGADGELRVWDLGTDQPVSAPIAAHEGVVWSVAVTADGGRIVSGGADGRVRVWDLATDQPVGDPITVHLG
jgi:WD40 repeat protein